MWNFSFLGSNGIVQISETGDRVSDYSLFDLNPTSYEFEVRFERKSVLGEAFDLFFIFTGSRQLFRC